MSPEEVSAASGKRATFILHVLTRQNATWQGTVDWLCGGEPTPFPVIWNFSNWWSAASPRCKNKNTGPVRVDRPGIFV